MHLEIRLLVFVCTVVPLLANAQIVKNVMAVQEGNTINIKYEISNGNYKQIYDTELYISVDNNKSWQGPMTHVTGDVGVVLSTGRKSMSWDILQEMQSIPKNLHFEVRVSVMKRPKKTFFTLSGSTSSALGITFGQLGDVGWYLSAKTNFNGNHKPSYEYSLSEESSEAIMWEYPADEYYVFTDLNEIIRYSITGGVTYQLSEILFVNAGVGYGVKKQLWQVENYRYSDDSLLGNSYVLSRDNSCNKGLEFETGMFFAINKLVVGVDANIFLGKAMNSDDIKVQRFDGIVLLGFTF